MKETVKLSLALSIICAVAATVLAVANDVTAPKIEEREANRRKQAIGLVLPAFDNDPMAGNEKTEVEQDGRSFTFYRARKDGKLVGLAGEGSTGQGFGGELKVLIGLGMDGSLGTVLVTSHKETPGLGTKVTDRKETRSIWGLFGSSDCGTCQKGKVPPSKYLDQFSNGFLSDAAPFTVTQDGGTVDAESGATVSSRAVADAVSLVCRAFEANRSEILNPTKDLPGNSGEPR